MDAIKNAYYRSFQAVFNVAARCLYWRKPITVEGEGALSKAPELFKKNHVKKVMIVTGRTVGKTIAPIAKAALDKAGIAYEHYSEVSANPTVTVVNEIQKKYLETGCEGFLAIGGGSPMDAAKGAAARVVHSNTPVNKMAGLLKVRHKIPTFVAVPTTAGTGSETTIAAVITDPETHHKYAIMDLCLVPKYAILDPELTRDLPQKTTSTTGMDALTHAVEAYIGKSNTKSTRDYAEKAVAIIFANLETAYKDGKNINARGQMLLGSFYGGMAFTRAYVGYVHAVAHNLGGMYGIPHGLANAVILPVMLEEYGAAIYPQLSKLANFAGIEGTSDDDKAKKFIAEVYAMNERMNIPKGFTQIKEEDIPTIVSRALKEANPLYPVPVIFDEDRMTQIVKKLMITE